MPALDDFMSLLSSINQAKILADEFAQLLEQRCDEAEELFQIAQQIHYEAQADRTLEAHILDEEQDRQQDWEHARDDLLLWRKESSRRTAIALCTAFETFLREFLIEQVLIHHEKLEIYLRETLSLSLSVVKPLPKNDLEDYLAINRHESFQDLLGRVSTIYDKLLGRSPFRKFEMSQNILLRKQFQTTLTDILLLFQIRHQLIHGNGQVNRKYYEKLNEYRCHERIDHELMEPYFDSHFFPDPDKILASPAINKTTFNTKLEECADALRLFGHYITAICTQTRLYSVCSPVSNDALCVLPMPFSLMAWGKWRIYVKHVSGPSPSFTVFTNGTGLVENAAHSRAWPAAKRHRTRGHTVREVLPHLPDITYKQLAEAAAAVHKPLEQWLIDILAAATRASATQMNRTTCLRLCWMPWALSATLWRRPADLVHSSKVVKSAR